LLGEWEQLRIEGAAVVAEQCMEAVGGATHRVQQPSV
jgi:hypothetical protein